MELFRSAVARLVFHRLVPSGVFAHLDVVLARLARKAVSVVLAVVQVFAP